MALKSTSLRKLGLTGGKAVIRFAQRPVDDCVMAEIISNLEKEQAKNARLEELAARQNSQTESETTDLSKNTLHLDKTETTETESNVKPDQSEYKQKGQNKVNDLQDSTVKESNKGQSKTESRKNDSEPMETETSDLMVNCMDVDSSTSDHIVTSGSRNLEQNGTVPLSQPEARRRAAESLRNMNIPGVEVITPDDFYDLTPREQQVARQMAAAYMQQMGVDVNQIRQGAPPTGQQTRRPPPQQSFQEFKFPEETKGQDLYHNEMSSASKEEYKPCDRETLLFSMDEEVKSKGTDQEIPDDFFEVTEKDVRKMMQDLQKNVENDQPLMTQAMRRAKLEEQYSKYERVVIRIQFPDKLVLQGLFRPRETVFAIKKYVKSYLEDKDKNFYLYTAPPKQVLKDNAATMIEAKLAPASVVYFGVDDDKVSDHYLSQAVLKEVGSRLKADEMVSRCFPKEDKAEEDNVMSGERSSGGLQPVKRSSTDRPRQPKETTGPQPGVPKWFKMGNK